MTIYNIIISECGIVYSCRTFSTWGMAKNVLDAELAWYRKNYSEDEDNEDEYKELDTDDCRCSFLFKSGDIRIDFMTGELD